MQRRIVRPQQSTSQISRPPRAVEQTAVTAYTIHQRNAVRSEDLVRAVRSLDTQTSPAARRELMDWIKEEYANRGGGVLLGLLAQCYLGRPYVDHTLSLDGFILEHYTPQEPPPAIFVPARPLARSQAYAYIEVYDDGAVVPVREDGRS